MIPDARKLLGGYATNTLTESEQKLLFEAALSDQDLFNALADEQALKQYLDDYEFRGELREALDPGPAGNLVAGSFAASPTMPRARATAAPQNYQAFGWIFAATVALSTLAIFAIAFHPPRQQTATFTPPPAAATQRPTPTIPADPPPPLIRQSAPEAAIPSLAAIKPVAPLPPSSRVQVAAKTFSTPVGAVGKVTDVNATILTIDLGTDLGIKKGSHLTIVRNGKPIGSLLVTTAAEKFCVGNYTGAQAKIGDRAASQ